MGNEVWKTFKLGDVTEIVGGGTPSTKVAEYWEGDIPWLTPRDLTNHSSRYISKGERSISSLGLNNSSAKMLPKGTVLLTSRAPIGYLAIAENPICTNQGFKSLIPNPEFVDSQFLYYLLKNNVEFLKSVGTGTTFAEISGSTLANLEFAFPSLSTQQKIVEMLSAFDDKIDLNRRMNETLEAIAQAIFKEWFVDFNYPGATGKLVPSSLGPIPEDWGISTLGDHGEFKNGINYSREDIGDTKFSIVNVRNIVENKIILKSSLDHINQNSDKGNQYLLREYDILIARSATPGAIAMVPFPGRNVIFSGFTIRYRLYTSNLFAFIFSQLLSIQNEIHNLANGTTLKSINQATLKSFSIILPSKQVIYSFNEIIHPLFSKLYENLIEIELLSRAQSNLIKLLIDSKGEN